MKLVELLARELSEWPECVSITQDYDGAVGLYSISNPTTFGAERAVWKFGGHIRNIAHLRRVASDRATAIVTRADWTAERARIAKPAKKADKDGWVRHRGGKCPVDGGAAVEVGDRDGDVYRATASELRWTHGVGGGDIMAYRLHKPAEQVVTRQEMSEAFAPTEPQGVFIPSKIDQIDGPIKWRDRITEIDATTRALTTERAELVQKLAGEGFALIGLINDLLTEAAQKHEDMSDWRNWKVGDLLEMVKASEWEGMTNGKLYEFASPENGYNFAVVDDGGELRSVCIGSNDYVTGDFKWHSRPSA